MNTAKEWYKQGGDLRKIALQAFTETELQSLPKSWEEYCKINPYLTKDKEFFLAQMVLLLISLTTAIEEKILFLLCLQKRELNNLLF